jgi:5-methylthioribose kinase
MRDDLLTPEEAIQYVKRNTKIFSETEQLKASVLVGDRMSVDGNANLILRVESEWQEGSVIVKQVLPFVRAAMENGIHMPLSVKRMRTDVQYMQVAERLCPNTSPKIYVWDEKANIVVMEDLRRMKILRFELMEGKRFHGFPKKMGEFLGRIASLTSEYHLSPWEKASFDQFFSGSYTDSLWSQFIFENSILNNHKNPINPFVREWVDQLTQDKAIHREVRGLKRAFLQQHQCLIHTDLHTSNIFVSQDEFKVFDSEFARYGPIGFDLGRLMGSLFLNYASLFGYREWEAEKSRAYQEYLLKTIQTLYEEFESQYFGLWEEWIPAREEAKARMKQLILQQSIGFIACVSMARIYDNGLCFDFKRIEDLRELSLHRSQKWD